VDSLGGEERLLEELGELSAEGSVAESVVSTLAAYKEAGETFDFAWYKAMHSLVPWDSADEDVRAEIDSMREVLHEVKPQLHEAYDGTPITIGEADKAAIRAERRLDRLTLSGPRHARARHAEVQPRLDKR
jgi:hypothetical protein